MAIAMPAMSGPATSSPDGRRDEVEAALEQHARSASRPNGRTAIIVMPSTSSNSTADPTTSSIRGSTLTCTPAALASRISSTTSAESVVVGAMMMRWTCSSSTMRRTLRGSSRSRLSPPHGKRGDDGRAGVAGGELAADPVGALALADDQAPLRADGVVRRCPEQPPGPRRRRANVVSHSDGDRSAIEARARARAAGGSRPPACTARSAGGGAALRPASSASRRSWSRS